MLENWICYVEPGRTALMLPEPDDLEQQRGVPQPDLDPHARWTLAQLLASPPPSYRLLPQPPNTVLYLLCVPKGNTWMGAREGLLYVSPKKEGLLMNSADWSLARRLLAEQP